MKRVVALLLATALSLADHCGFPPSRVPEIRDIHPARPATRRRSEGYRPPFSPLLQLVHPPPPFEREWVLVAGNESQVDAVLGQALSIGARLVSMGFFTELGSPQYYAIMHKFKGPVFIKPPPMSHEDLIRAVKENEMRDLALSQVCGQELEGKLSYVTYWEYLPGIEQHIWFPGTEHADEQKIHFEAIGLRLTFLCGFVVSGEARYVGVWQRRPPALSSSEAYEAHYGLPLHDCLTTNALLAKRNFVARHFTVFQLGTQLLCTGIWEHAPGHRHYIRVGTSLQSMFSEFSSEASLLPHQISHYLSAPRTAQYVVLWSDLHSDRFPNPPPLWDNMTIPSQFVEGSTALLTPAQLAFAIQRIEALMKTYDLPGLSIAIAKHERLKFAAGFGYSDIRRGERVSPTSLFRIGSVSKPITASALFLLVDRGLVNIDQPIFGGVTSLFGNLYATNGSYGKYVEMVTLRNLLEHSTGGWDNEEGDVAWSQGKANISTLVRTVLGGDLPAPPGRRWVYSNFGYLLIGLAIERISGLSYETFIHSSLLAPVGAADTFLARATLMQRASNEVLYYMSGSGLGFDPYEMLPPQRIGPWGGWVANPIQMLKFLAAVDGSRVRRDILSERAIVEIATASKVSNGTYGSCSLGWSINVMGFNGWQHDGRMPGASAMLVRLASGHSMAITTNKEFTEREFFHDVAYTLHHLTSECDWWNDSNDLFPPN